MNSRTRHVRSPGSVHHGLEVPAGLADAPFVGRGNVRGKGEGAFVGLLEIRGKGVGQGKMGLRDPALLFLPDGDVVNGAVVVLFPFGILEALPEDQTHPDLANSRTPLKAQMDPGRDGISGTMDLVLGPFDMHLDFATAQETEHHGKPPYSFEPKAVLGSFESQGKRRASGERQTGKSVAHGENPVTPSKESTQEGPKRRAGV